MREVDYLRVDGRPAVLITDHEAKSVRAWILRDGKWEWLSPPVASFEGALVARESLGDLPEVPETV